MTKDQFYEQVEAIDERSEVFVQLNEDGTLLVHGVFKNVAKIEQLVAIYKRYEEEAQCPF